MRTWDGIPDIHMKQWDMVAPSCNPNTDTGESWELASQRPGQWWTLYKWRPFQRGLCRISRWSSYANAMWIHCSQAKEAARHMQISIWGQLSSVPPICHNITLTVKGDLESNFGIRNNAPLSLGCLFWPWNVTLIYSPSCELKCVWCFIISPWSVRLNSLYSEHSLSKWALPLSCPHFLSCLLLFCRRQSWSSATQCRGRVTLVWEADGPSMTCRWSPFELWC